MKKYFDFNSLKMESNFKYSELETYSSNPFLPNLLIPKKAKNVILAKSDKMLVSKDDSTVSEALFLSKRMTLDKDDFIKVFHSQLQIMFDLSKTALKVFGYIASITKMHDDRVIFEKGECTKYTGYRSNETIYRALTELVSAEFIAKTNNPNVFYINPQVFFKGDRLVLINDYRLKSNNKIQKDPKQAEIDFENY